MLNILSKFWKWFKKKFKSSSQKVVNTVAEVKKVNIKKAVESKYAKLVCAHQYKFKAQVWSRTSANQFQLKNKFTCSKCHKEDIRVI